MEDKALAEEALERLKDARAQKSVAAPDIQETYFFLRPRLCDHVSSQTAPPTRRGDVSAADELATGIGSELAEDFATEVIAAFFPEDVEWVQETAVGVDDDELSDALATRSRIIFDHVKQSNFYAELSQALDPDLAHGTTAFWITDPGGGLPVHVEHVPVRELEVNVGPNGDIDDCFRVRHVKVSKIKAVLPNTPLPKKASNKKSGTIEVVWAYWRDWSEPLDYRYQFVLLVDGEVAESQILQGIGSVPLVVARMSPDKLHAFGHGPAIKGLTEFRVLDCITAGTLDRIDIAIAPPFGYPGDGITDFENGIESGKAYAMRPGAGRDVVPLYFEGNPDLGFYTIKDIEHRLRRKFFADYPEQTGDTPPSATQWIDEMAMAQRRIGTPGAKFFSEGPVGIYRRFAFLLTQRGVIEEITQDGRSVALIANNPAVMARDSQKVRNGVELLNTAKTMFPMTSQAAIDEYKTIDKIKKLMRDDVVVLRNEAQAMELVQSILASQQQAAEGEQ